MKDIKRILAFTLTLVMLASAFAFAAPAQTVVSIVSPTANTVTTSDKLLVSVKLTNPGKARITVYEQCIKNVEILTTGSALEKNLSTYAAVSYESVDTTSYEAIDLTSNAALATYASRVYSATEIYENKDKIGFYTKQISDVKPGLYKVVAQALDEKGNIVETVSSLIAIKAKPVEEQPVVFEQKQSAAVKLLQNLLQAIFK